MCHESRLSGEYSNRCVRTTVPLLLVWCCLVFWAGSGEGSVFAADPPQKPADSELDDPAEKMPAELRTKIAGRLKHPAANTRIAALKEIGDYRGADALQLILSYGLRDRSPEVHDTAARALLRDKTDARIGKYLISQFELEAAGKKRQNQAYTQRLLEVASEFRVPEVYRELLQLADQGEPALAGGVVEGLMASLDKAAAEKDVGLLPILETLATSDTYQRSFGFRRCVIDAVASVRHVDAVTLLLRQLRNARAMRGVAALRRHAGPCR